MHYVLRTGLVITAVMMTSAIPLTASRRLAQDAPSKDVAPQAQMIVELLAKQEFPKVVEQFQVAVKAAMPEDRLRSTWNMVLAQAGPFKQQKGVRTETRGTYRVAVVTCEFDRAVIDIQLVFDGVGQVAGLSFRPYAPPVSYSPPPYADATKYTEAEVTVGGPDWPLPGTLTMPNGPGPFAAVVLVHGSGPNDRDETLGPNKTFKDLAHGLAARGIAVLRYDKRTKVFGAKLGSIQKFTVKDETIDDAIGAVALLRKTPKINPARIVVIGHSLGGMLIPRIGAADTGIAGLVSMAGVVRELDRTMLEQTRYLVEADGRITADEQKALDNMEALVKTVAALTPADAANSKAISGAPASYWLDLRGYDPPAAAKALTQPLLILQGERDYQVTMVGDFAKWKAALDGKPGVTFRTYPALNHLFLPGSGKSLPAEYETPGHVPDEVIADIAAWIAAIK